VKTLNQKIGEKGSAAVEFAIILPLLVSLVFGIIDFGLLLYNKQVITNASREGARAGIARSTISIESVVDNYCRHHLFPDGTLPSSVNVSGRNGPFQSDLTVTVTYAHSFLFAGIIGISPTITMTGRTVMKMEPVPPASP
jgi:Flp pilus assembly protein TadG